MESSSTGGPLCYTEPDVPEGPGRRSFGPSPVRLSPKTLRKTMQAAFRRLPRALFLSGVLALSASGCGAASPGAQDASGLPTWEGDAQTVFSDDIEPEAVGLSLEPGRPRIDAKLRHRAQTADVVARVRVQTVTLRTVGDKVTYHLGIQVGQPPLIEPAVDDQTFELTIAPHSPAYGIAKAFGTRLKGMTFIGFVKRFANMDGELEVHFHFAPDSAEVANAVKEAVALREMSGS